MTDEPRLGREATTGELTARAHAVLARHIPGYDPADYAGRANRSPHPSLNEMAAFNREQATRAHRYKTPAKFVSAVADHPTVQAWAIAWTRTIIGAKWLLLQGGTGTAKTHQAYGALALIADSGLPVVPWRAVNAADLFARMRPGGADNPEALLTELAGAQLLLVDDLGASRHSEFTEETIYRLLNRRYEDNLATIITTNHTVPEIEELFGDRVASRLKEMCIRVNLGTTDRRTAPEAL